MKQELKKNRSIQFNRKKQIKKPKKKNYLVQPPFNEEVSNNIIKEFFTLLNKHFPSSNRYQKIFNKINIKLSYSCLPNVKSLINKQKTSRLNNPGNKVDAKQCNCRSAIICPLNGKCCRNSMISKLKRSRQSPEI